jgi:murein DD-endopeptidase MepM/ murein hydrolase activator NlpD
MATTLGVPTDRVRAIAAGLAAAATLLVPTIAPDTAAAATTEPSYGWPVKPFHRQHPVRGFFGDPRIGMTPKGIHRGFHFGIDISCPNGTPVYATLDGVVRLESFRPETVAVVAGDGHTEFQYWHIRPAVRHGQRVEAYETVVGWAAAPWEHVHFSELRDEVYVNPLRPGALGPFSDATQPWVKQLRAEAAGRPLAAIHGTVALVVEAYDETPVRVPGPWGGMPVTPALLRWRLTTTGDRVVRRWVTAVDHRLTIPSDDHYDTQYARWTRQNKKTRPGRYRFVLATGWDSTAVGDGLYDLEVEASDVLGNRRRVHFPIRITNRTGVLVGH